MIRYLSQAQQGAWALKRRDFHLGWLLEQARPPQIALAQMVTSWQQSHALHCPNLLAEHLPQFSTHIQQSLSFITALVQGEEVFDFLDEAPYAARLKNHHFEALMSSQNEGDAQELEKITFDALDQDGQLIAENLWAKFAWLSLHDDDASMRCRFSFGLESYEDVAADPQRETLAATLCHSIFPESALLSSNPLLQTFMQQISDKAKPEFVECIAYFNAPNGGALFHHDVEAGHAGAVYAQLSGHTAWFALSKTQLIAQIMLFVQAEHDLSAHFTAIQQQQLLAADAVHLAQWLDADEREALDILLNETPAFMQQLTKAGYAHVLHAGDVMLLPQTNTEACAWHSVIGLGDEMSHALSFAVN